MRRQHSLKTGRQVAQSVERRTLEAEVPGSNPCRAPGGGVGFHLTSPIRRALRRRRPHYSQSGDPQWESDIWSTKMFKI